MRQFENPLRAPRQLKKSFNGLRQRRGSCWEGRNKRQTEKKNQEVARPGGGVRLWVVTPNLVPSLTQLGWTIEMSITEVVFSDALPLCPRAEPELTQVSPLAVFTVGCDH